LENDPEGQAEQDVEPLPAAYDPAAHGRHIVDPADAVNVPAGQRVQELAAGPE
jgi:hypothetical protein